MRSPKWSQLELVTTVVLVAAAYAPSVLARPWSEHNNHLGSMARQLVSTEHEIQELIERKGHTVDPKQVAEIMRSIAERHRSLVKTSKDYEEERQHVRFEHPERNDQLDRKYVRHEVKSVEEMESGLSIDARLDRVRAMVLAKFPVPERKMTTEEKSFRTRLPASNKREPDDEAPEKIKLVK